MAEFFSSGLAIEVVLGFLLMEGVILSVLKLRFQLGPPLAQVWSMLGAGAGLLLALRAAIADAGWQWVAASLLLALLAHMLDLRGRWPTSSP